MKRAMLLLLALSAAACTSDTTAPVSNVLVGTWGGAGLLLSAQRSSVRAEFGCDEAEFPAPIRLNTNGEFVLPGTVSHVSASVQIGAQGAASGDTITIEVIRWYPGGTASEQFTVIRDKPAVMPLCALSNKAAGA